MRKIYTLFVSFLLLCTLFPCVVTAKNAFSPQWRGTNDGFTTITLPEAGKLKDLLPREDRPQVIKLRLAGPVNHRDFWIIYACSNLQVLDLSSTNLIDDGNGTANALPDKAFDGHASLQEIILPPTLKSIGNYTFRKVKTLSTIQLPASVEKLGAYTFQFCEKITKLDLPESFIKFGNGTFTGCKGLTEFTIPAGVTEITEGLFQNCANLAKVNLPKDIVSIGYGAFSGTAIQEIHLGEKVANIAKNAFKVLVGMTKIYCKATTPPEAHINAFLSTDYANAILYIQDSVRSAYLDHAAWSQFQHIENLPASGDDDTTDQEEIAIVLEEAGTLKDKVPVNKVLSVKKMVITGLLNKADFDYLRTFINIEELDHSGAKIVDDGNGVANRMPDDALKGLSKLASYQFATGLTTIGSHAFMGTALTSVTLPEGITAIESGAFMNIASLQTIVMHSGIVAIPASCFAGDTSLSQVVLSNDATTIGEKAFSGCTALSLIGLPSNLTTIGNNAFAGTAIKQLSIGKKVSSIGSEAFKGVPLNSIICLPLTAPEAHVSTFDDNIYTTASLEIPKSAEKSYRANEVWKKFTNLVIDNSPTVADDGFVEIYCNRAGDLADLLSYPAVKTATKLRIFGVMNYYDFRKLKETTQLQDLDISTVKVVAVEGKTDMDGNLKYPEDHLPRNAFSSSTTLARVSLPTSIVAIDLYAFGECSALEEIVVPDSVKTIGYQAFFYCTKLRRAVIPQATVDNGRSIFSQCTALTEVELPAMMKSIPSTTFYNCRSLQQLSIPEEVTEIGSAAFENTAFTTLTIPAGVVKIGEEAFTGCHLNELVLLGSAPQVVERTFDTWHFSNTVLKIKKKFLDSYLDDVVWSLFASIVDVDTGEVLSNESVALNSKYVVLPSGDIKILSSVGNVSVRDISGRCLYRMDHLESGSIIELPNDGTYIVEIGNETIKTIKNR